MTVAIWAHMNATQLLGLNWERLCRVWQLPPGSWLHRHSRSHTHTHTHSHTPQTFRASLRVYFNLNSMSKVGGREAVHRAPSLIKTREGASPSMYSI